MTFRGLAWRALLGATALTLMGHSPYRQWFVFREKHLIVVSGDDDRGAFPVGEAIARTLSAELPEAKPLAARTRTAVDAVKLLRSHQLPLGLLPASDALAAVNGKGRFSRYGPMSLRAVAVLGPYVLVALEDLPQEKVRLVAQALAGHQADAALPKPSWAGSPIPWHPGALALQQGRAPVGG